MRQTLTIPILLMPILQVPYSKVKEGRNIPNLTVHQSIVIYTLRVNSIANSSVLQIGSAGIIKPLSHPFHTGESISPAAKPGTSEQPKNLLVPLPPPN
ncbi:spore germination protein GerPB [Aneurinibacillus aneurinilyticus]|uniref:spore germination protein GerPB n=2 Tax=Aneurinibacillus aneurinilyticus TaxID=1391 RepID=UPI002E1D7A20